MNTVLRSASAQSTVIQAYRFALDPTSAQIEMLLSHCGAQRFAYNWALRTIRANLAQRVAERSYGVDDDLLTPSMNWSAYALRKRWNQVKDEIAPWWHENSKEAYSSGIANLCRALSNWSSSASGGRAGTRMRFPVPKSRKSAMSCRFTTGAFGLVDSDRRHVRLPRIGKVRTHESTRKLARRVAAGTARIRSATVSRSCGRWFVSFSVEIDKTRTSSAHAETVVGVDLGLRNLAVLSEAIPGVSDEQGIVRNSDHLEHVLSVMRRLQRQSARRRGPDRRTDAAPSQRWLRSRAKIARQHFKVVNARRDSLHKLTTALVRSFGVVVIEDLNVAGMVRNRCLARRIEAAAWGEFRRQLGYKLAWHGGKLVVAGRFFPSTKTCSSCGAVKAKLRPSVRQYDCDVCGLSVDRDVNAARNLGGLIGPANTTSSPSCGATENEPDGNSRKTRSFGIEYRHGKPVKGNVA